MSHDSQRLRILIAGFLAALTTAGTVFLAATTQSIPTELGFINVACVTYLFGVVTNGGGLGGSKPPTQGGLF